MGSTGGRRRAQALMRSERIEIARKGAIARWAKYRKAAEEAAEIDRKARELAKELYGDPYADLGGEA